MNELIIVAFDNQHKAEQVRLDLLRMDREHLIDLEDAVVLDRDEKGQVKLHHATHLTLGGAIGGGFLGTLMGMLLLNPIFAAVGLAAGSALGAVSGSMTHLGIDEDFMTDLAKHLQPGTSALCVLVREHLDKVLEELYKFDGKIIRASLKHADEESLRQALDQLKAGI
jgi:uncharacterized membrane protein